MFRAMIRECDQALIATNEIAVTDKVDKVTCKKCKEKIEEHIDSIAQRGED
jgi:hypothetical protein